MPKCKTGRRFYKDELAAKIALASVARRDKGEKRYYQCPFCPGWHLTSQNKRDA